MHNKKINQTANGAPVFRKLVAFAINHGYAIGFPGGWLSGRYDETFSRSAMAAN
jgi:hypothetical protein